MSEIQKEQLAVCEEDLEQVVGAGEKAAVDLGDESFDKQGDPLAFQTQTKKVGSF